MVSTLQLSVSQDSRVCACVCGTLVCVHLSLSERECGGWVGDGIGGHLGDVMGHVGWEGGRRVVSQAQTVWPHPTPLALQRLSWVLCFPVSTLRVHVF